MLTNLMKIVSVSQFGIYLPWSQSLFLCLALSFNGVLNVKVLVGALVGVFSVIVKSTGTFG